MNTLDLLLSIASDVRQASLSSGVLKLARRYRELNETDYLRCYFLFTAHGIVGLDDTDDQTAFVIELLNIECWITHGQPITEYWQLDVLIKRVEQILTEHSYLSPNVTAE